MSRDVETALLLALMAMMVVLVVFGGYNVATQRPTEQHFHEAHFDTIGE
jgi:hypothetical protein